MPMQRSEKITSEDDSPAPLPHSPASGFVWAGMLCLLLSGIVGVQSILQASRSQSDAPLGNLYHALLILLCSVPLFYAQVRYLFWRRASGALIMHSSQNAAPIEIKKKPLPADHAERWLIVVGLMVLAGIPRYLALLLPMHNEETVLLRALSGNSSAQDSGLFAYVPIAQWLAAQYQGLRGVAGIAAVPLWFLRLPAFVCGVGAVPMLYLAVKFLLGRPIALASALMLALFPAAVAASGKAECSAVVLFLAIAQCYFLARAVRDCEAGMWLGWLACMVTGTLFAPTFWVLVVLDMVFLMARAVWVSSRMRLRGQGAALLEQAVVLGATYVVFVWVSNIFMAWHMTLPRIDIPLLTATKPFTTSFANIVGVGFILVGLAALALRPSALPFYAVLIFALGFGAGASALVAPLLFVLLAAGVEQIVGKVIGESERKSLARETTLYVLTLLWLVLHFPLLRAALPPLLETKKRAITVTESQARTGSKR